MLERIQKENDIKNLNGEELEILAEEIRQFLVEKVSRTGGHLASNLGVVELTMALHLMFDLPQDKIIWDVGHQSYTHKLLTGRKEGFDDLRRYGGMSGFPKRKESPCDAFDTGHSSTSISAGLGLVAARDLKGEDYRVISVIGDGSLTGGMAYEALNNAAHLKTNFIIVLNDNHMSISENVGGMSRYLAKLRTADIYTGLKKGVTNTLHSIPVIGDPLIEKIRKTKSSIKQLVVPGMFFEDMGITYLGPVPGHNLSLLCRALREASKIDGPVLLHVLTRKGKGYAPAEQAPDKFHGIGPFDIATGEVCSSGEKKDSYTDVFGKVLCDEARRDPKIAAITAAMADGTGLSRFRRMFPDRFFDVGIAEEHAVTFAAGLAAGGMKPVFALSYLGSIPNMTILSPKNKWELADMLRFALAFEGPVALRYPRGTAYDGYREFRAPVVYGKSEMIREEKDIALVSVGHMFETAAAVRDMLKEKGYSCTLVNARFVKPLDEEMFVELSRTHGLIGVIEENVPCGSFGERVLAFACKRGLKARILPLSLPDDYVEHGSVEILRRETGLDPESLTERILEAYKEL